MPEPHLRAADADRAAVAEALGRAMSAGRLTIEEYDDRLARAYAARTYGDLAPLTADLPDQPQPAPVRAPAPAHVPAGTPDGGCAGRPGGPQAWRRWAATALVVVSIWLVTMVASQQFIFPWPLWVIGPWGAVLLAHRVRGDSPGDGPRRLPG